MFMNISDLPHCNKLSDYYSVLGGWRAAEAAWASIVESDPVVARILQWLVPPEMRTWPKFPFTQSALVGTNSADEWNHPHYDHLERGVPGAFVMVGDPSMKGGSTVFYDTRNTQTRQASVALSAPILLSICHKHTVRLWRCVS